MNCKIIATHTFHKDIKKLSKKYPSLKQELIDLQNLLIENPRLGTPLGNNCYKIRLSVRSKGKGKSSGLRIITSVLVKTVKIKNQTHVILLTAYDKSSVRNITPKRIDDLLKSI